MTEPEDIHDELSHLKKLWNLHTQRKRLLELNEAKKGIGAEPEITIELQLITERMQAIEERYRRLRDLL